MSKSRTFRVSFVGSLIVAMVGMIALSGWLLWPEWQRYWVRQIVSAGLARDQERCLEAIEMLDKLQAGEAVADELLALTKDPDDGVRIYAIVALAVFQPRPQTVIARLVAVLEDPKEAASVRAAAAIAIGEFGVDAKEALPSLTRAAETWDLEFAKAMNGTDRVATPAEQERAATLAALRRAANIGSMRIMQDEQIRAAIGRSRRSHYGYSARELADDLLISTDDEGSRARVLAGKK